MNTFLEIHNIQKLNEEESERQNRLMITAGKIEAVIKNLLANKSPGPVSFTGKFYKGRVNPYFSQIIKKYPRRGKILKLFL